jgi:hypothetical protein
LHSKKELTYTRRTGESVGEGMRMKTKRKRKNGVRYLGMGEE